MKINIPKLTEEDHRLIIKTAIQFLGLWLVVIVVSGIYVRVV